MKQRHLLLVDDDKRRGSVGIGGDGNPFFRGQARDVFSGARRRAKSDTVLMNQLLSDGWSNGYLYLGPVEEK